MRLQIAEVEKHADRLFERIERLQDRLPVFVDAVIEYVSGWGRRKRWDFLMQNLRQLVVQLQHVSESMHTTLAALGESLNEEELSGGLSSIISPQKRFQQEQMLIDLKLLQQQSKLEFREATELLQRLTDLTLPNEADTAQTEHHTENELSVIHETDGERMVDLWPPRVVESRMMIKNILDGMQSDIADGAIFGHSKEEYLALAAAQANEEEAIVTEEAQQSSLPVEARGADERVQTGVSLGSDRPTLVAIADLDPPVTHQAQMLKLSVGDLVTVIGQDGRGWWYGRKQNGKEGWFPPSYVQVKPAHFTLGGTQSLKS